MADLVYGMLPEERVATVLLRLQEHIGDEWVCVVRSIDSIRSPRDLSYCLSAHGIPNHVVFENVCISAAALLRKALGAEVFSGFDEVWAFEHGQPAGDLNGLPSATSESTNFGQEVPQKLVEAIERYRCALVLGDGCGLNYATTKEEIIEVLAGNSA